MPSLFADPPFRSRLIEYLGGDLLDHATAVYITQSDACQERMPLELGTAIGCWAQRAFAALALLME